MVKPSTFYRCQEIGNRFEKKMHIMSVDDTGHFLVKVIFKICQVPGFFAYRYFFNPNTILEIFIFSLATEVFNFFQ